MVKVWNYDTERLEREIEIIEKEMQIGIRVGTLSAQGLTEMNGIMLLQSFHRRSKLSDHDYVLRPVLFIQVTRV